MKKIYALLLASTILGASSAQAEIGEIYSPLVTKNQAEIEYKGARLDDSDRRLNNLQGHELEINYGVTDDLRLGLLATDARDSDSPSSLRGYGAQAIYTLTRQKDWWLNSGVYGEYIFANHDDRADSLQGRLLLSRTQGPVTVNANFILNRQIGDNRIKGIGMGTSLQGLYDIHNEHFTPGIEWHGDFGKLNDIENDDNQHYVGPVLTGEITKFGDSELEYVAGYYWGVTDRSADNAARIQLNYAMHF